MNPDHSRIAVLDAPSNLGLKPPSPDREPGVRYMAASLRKLDLVRRLRAYDAGEVSPPKYHEAVEENYGIRNATAIRDYSVMLANRVEGLLNADRFPFVVGGDCSILLGSALALRRRGRCGLLFIDGHTDLLTPDSSASSGAGGMDLSLVTGKGPCLLTAIEGHSPYIEAADVVLFGYRQPDPKSDSPGSPLPPMTSYPLVTIRAQGIAAAGQQAVGHFENREFWIHLDLDVLDPKWMPAVDSPDPGGMSPDQLASTLRIALSSKKCLGMEISSYDPTLDQGGQYCKLVVDVLENAFRI